MSAYALKPQGTNKFLKRTTIFKLCYFVWERIDYIFYNLNEFNNSILFYLVSIKNDIRKYTLYVKESLVIYLKRLLMLLFFLIAFYLLYLNILELFTPLYCCSGAEYLKEGVEQYQVGVDYYKEQLRICEIALSHEEDPSARSNILREIGELQNEIKESEEARNKFIDELRNLRLQEQASSGHNVTIVERTKRSITEAGSGFENSDSKRKG